MTDSDVEFWLARLDASLPRAQLVPDFKHSSTAAHTYETITFAPGQDLTRRLKAHASTDSDVALCTSILSVLLAKYHRHDELIVGLATPTSAAVVVPVRLSCSLDTALK